MLRGFRCVVQSLRQCCAVRGIRSLSAVVQRSGSSTAASLSFLPQLGSLYRTARVFSHAQGILKELHCVTVLPRVD